MNTLRLFASSTLWGTRPTQARQRALVLRLACLAMLAGTLPFLPACEMTPAQTAPAVYVSPTPLPPVGVLYTVGRGTIQDVLTVRGRVEPVREAQLAFKMEGWLKTLTVSPGDPVEAGDVLAELDSPVDKGRPLEEAIADAEYQVQSKTLDLEQAQAAPLTEKYFEAKAKVSQADIARQASQAAYDRISWRGDAAASSPEAMALQGAQANYEVALAAFKAQEAEIKTQELTIKRLQTDITYAQRQLAIAKARLADAQLKAPFSGLIVTVDKRVGDHIVPYEAVGSIADPSQVRVVVSVSGSDMARLAFGQPVTVTLDAYPAQPLAGVVAGIAAQPSVWQGKSTYEATIQYNDPSVVPAAIQMGADVSIVTRVAKNVLIVPIIAVQAEGEHKYVELLNSPPRRTEVGTGIASADMVEVVRGLAEGDRIRLR